MIGRRAPWLAGALMVVASLVTLGAWTLASPPGSSPDDNFHLASLWCAGGISDSCAADPNGDPDVRLIPARVIGAPCYHGAADKSARCQDKLPPSLVPDTPVGWGNWNGLYPPVFYRVMGTVVGDDLDTSILRLRALNGLVVVALVASLAALVPARLRRVAVLPVVVTSVPLGLNLFASTNPSSWAVASAATLWLSLYAIPESRGARRWLLAALALISVVLGSGSRADACLFSAMAIAVVFLLRWRELRREPLLVVAGLVGLGISVVFFAGTGQSELVGTGLPEETLGLSWWELGLLNVQQLPVLWFGSFGYGGLGSLGWFDTALPALVLLSLCVWVIVVFDGWREVSRRKGVALGLVGAAFVVYPLAVLEQSGVEVGLGFQPRYLLPLLVLFAGLSVLPVVGLRRSAFTRLQVVALAVGLALAQCLALAAQIRRYVTGQDVTGFALDRDREWWWNLPVSATFVWIAGSLAFALLAYLALREYAAEVPPTADPDAAEGPTGDRAAIPGRSAATAA